MQSISETLTPPLRLMLSSGMPYTYSAIRSELLKANRFDDADLVEAIVRLIRNGDVDATTIINLQTGEPEFAFTSF